MAETPTSQQAKELALEEISARAFRAQEVLVNLVADAIGIYLTEHLIEMELRIHRKELQHMRSHPPSELAMPNMDEQQRGRQVVGNAISSWLARSRLMNRGLNFDFQDKTKSAELGQALDAMLDAKGDEQAKAIQAFVHQAYHSHGSPLRMISQRIPRASMREYRGYLVNYVDQLNQHDAAIHELYENGVLSTQDKRKLGQYIRHFGLFRDGLADFPRIPDDLVKKHIVPHFHAPRTLPANPIGHLLNQVNELVYQRQYNIIHGGEAEKHNPAEMKGGMFDSNLMASDMSIMNLYETGKKSPGRIREKVELEGKGDFSCILSSIKDAARAKIVVDDMPAMMRVNEILSQLVAQRGFSEDKKPIRMNLRGAWDSKRNITVELDDGKKLCTEVQVINKQMQDIDMFSHQIYSLIRFVAPDGEHIRGRQADEHKILVSEFRDFVQQYNGISERLNSTRGLFGSIREADPDRYRELQRKIKPISEDEIKGLTTGKRADGIISKEMIGKVGKMVGDLHFLHQAITSFAALSRTSSENRGDCHPSMSAAYRVLAQEANARHNGHLKISEDLMPAAGSAFSQGEHDKVAQMIADYNGAIGKEAARGNTR